MKYMLLRVYALNGSAFIVQTLINLAEYCGIHNRLLVSFSNLGVSRLLRSSNILGSG